MTNFGRFDNPLNSLGRLLLIGQAQTQNPSKCKGHFKVYVFYPIRLTNLTNQPNQPDKLTLLNDLSNQPNLANQPN